MRHKDQSSSMKTVSLGVFTQGNSLFLFSRSNDVSIQTETRMFGKDVGEIPARFNSNWKCLRAEKQILIVKLITNER